MNIIIIFAETNCLREPVAGDRRELGCRRGKDLRGWGEGYKVRMKGGGGDALDHNQVKIKLMFFLELKLYIFHNNVVKG